MLCRVFLPRHSAKQLFFYLLEKGFAECIYLVTRRSLKLCRVPDAWHSGKSQTSPSASVAALGKARNFTEYCQLGTRRSLNLCRVPRVWHSAKFSTPSRSAVPFVPFARSIRQFACSSVPFQLFLPSAAWHTAKVCRVPEKRHSAKPASQVEERSCALRRVLHSAKKLPSVFRPLPSVCDTRQSTRVR